MRPQGGKDPELSVRVFFYALFPNFGLQQSLPLIPLPQWPVLHRDKGSELWYSFDIRHDLLYNYMNIKYNVLCIKVCGRSLLRPN